jgi:gas vesicle protein
MEQIEKRKLIMRKHSNKFFIGTIIGGTIGAITTLLFNTQEGKKIQKKLMKKFHEMGEKNSFALPHLALGKNKILSKFKRKRKARRTK